MVLRLGLLRRRTVDQTIGDLSDSKAQRQINAAIWIWAQEPGRFDEQERARLIEALQPVSRPSEGARAEAISALVKLGAPGAVDLALDALSKPETGMRMVIASMMSPTDDSRVVDALIALLQEADGYVREAAAIGLKSQGDKRALGPLQEMLDSGERDSAAKSAAKRTIRALESTRANRS